MGEVVSFTGVTRGRVDPSSIVSAAEKLDFKELILIGVDKDGEPYLATSTGDPAKILWYLESAKQVLLNS